MKTLIGAAALALMATSSLAGDWTAGYVGAGIGYNNVSISDGVDGGSGGTAGLHGGYDYDFGDWVVGGELEYDWMSIGLGRNATTADLDNVARLKLKVGYDFDDWLFYGVLGGARAYTDDLGNGTGWLGGIGASYLIAPQWSVSGEILYHRFSDYNDLGVDVDATTLNVRASYRF